MNKQAQYKMCMEKTESFRSGLKKVIEDIAGGVRYVVNVNAPCFVKIPLTALLHF